jgi:hypothetical protein
MGRLELAPGEHRAHFAVGPHDAVLQLGCGERPDCLQDLRAVVGMDDFEEAFLPPVKLFRLQADDAAGFPRQRRVPALELALPVAHLRDALRFLELALALLEAAEHQETGERVREPAADLDE